ncbi:polyamine-transporting ATPase 13A3-like isoform X7 [Portunus trituberculatus]|uniref:polyamine-transporting ATPase 13A3-like isoform X7 n=1 Tax=Portunus trituberculatus TaxID=210409 RepID=UPI001E1CE969|nr:polyamine-transporting ATPase 13A3-like isoform X7 [Portunus trituberculatus]
MSVGDSVLGDEDDNEPVDDDASDVDDVAAMSYDRLGEDPGGLSQHQAVLQPGTEEELTLHGYRSSPCQTFFFHLVSVLTLGSLYLVTYWRPEWRLAWTTRKCALVEAESLILVDRDGKTHVETVHVEDVGSGFPKQYVVTCHRARVKSGATLNGASDSTHLTDAPQRVMRYFIYQHVKYVWVPEKLTFLRLGGFDQNTLISSLLNDFRGFTVEEEMQRQQLYGFNVISVEVRSYSSLLLTEVLNPFYVFQVCSILLWSFDNYYLYASCIFFISLLSVAISLYETRKQSQSLHDMVEASNVSSVSVLRITSEKTSEEVTVDSKELVPGDVVVVPPEGCTMPCDAVLISGTAIVNESMLTGESVPVTKTPITVSEETEVYSAEQHKRHTLFCGTSVIQTRYYGSAQVLAVVVRTGFNTAKGELVRSILYPRPLDFKFYKDAMKFILFLFFIASIGMSYSIYIYIVHEEGFVKTLVRTLDIVTIVVPPALPAAMTVGTYYAQSRLKKKAIFCISPPRINVSGKIKLVCFDKTGTLTEDGLEVWGVLEAKGVHLGSPVMDVSTIEYSSQLMAAMATCHSLTYLHGSLTGDPLDVKMFEATKWTLEEAAPGSTNYDQVTPTIVKPSHQETYVDPPRHSNMMETPLQVPYEIGIVRQFPFSSSTQRMSVIVRVLGQQQMDLYVKGAPEVIMNLCVSESLPDDFGTILNKYTLQGFRVIALAHRRLQTKLSWHAAQRIPRTQVEKDLVFVGLLVLQNMLKPETTPVIRQLAKANIRTVMVTGDNILTAISVARDCDMVGTSDRILVAKASPPTEDQPASLIFEAAHALDPASNEKNVCVSIDPKYHLAISGKAWSVIYQHFPDLVPRIVARGTVFARMSPDQKAHLVEELQAINYIVAMCGDGANDCGALKAAHVGISLSEAEASVAAPFTSHTSNISCVPQVVCEGRCALTTNFSVFKYMALYSIIQFVSVLILYSAYTNLSDAQFLYIDLFIVTVIAIFMGYTEPSKELVPQKPLGNLLGAANMFSILSQIFLVILFQVIAYFFLLQQLWFEPNQPSKDQGPESLVCWEATIIFYVSSFQYLILCITYSPGKPFRKPLITNVWLTVALLVLGTANLLMVLSPWSWLMDFMGLYYDTNKHMMFRITLLLMVTIHMVISYSIELLINSGSLKKCFQCVTCKQGPKNKYKLVLRDMEADSTWPPMSTPLYGL